MKYKKGDSVTIRHPAFGTLGLHNCDFSIKGYVVGDLLNFDTPTGDGCILETMNFPITCIVHTKEEKAEEDVLEEYASRFNAN